MVYRIFILLVFSLLYSCRSYDSEKYISHENEAINDIIVQLIQYDKMVEMNYLDTNHLKIFLISSLDTAIYNIHVPREFERYYNVSKCTVSEIEEYKKIYEEMCKKHKKEQKAFMPIKKGVLKKRILEYKFSYPNLQVEIISEYPEKFGELKQNEYGFLYISRIIFNKQFDKGYLSYDFWCGQGCWWSENIEIVKINGKWKISEAFSGGIA